MRDAPAALLLLAVAAGCYGTPKGTHSGKAGSGGTGAGGGQAGAGGTGGSVGASTAGGGSAGAAAGHAGTGGGSGSGTAGVGGTGGSAAVFVGGPCVATSNWIGLEVFGRSTDGHIHRRMFDGTNWGNWGSVAALDGTMIDARSDLDCGASATSTHLVATGLSPIGSFLHAFGLGTVFNPFVRELTSSTFAPGPSIADLDDSHYSLGALASGATFPVLYEFGETATPVALTPITTETNSFRSAPDIAVEPAGASKLTFFAGFDDTGSLSIDYHVINSGGAYWGNPVKLSAPVGAFTFSPTICVEIGAFGVYSVNVAAVAGDQLWYARTSSITDPFSSWMPIAPAPASSPDCAVVGRSESVVHVVALSTAGSVLDISGKGTAWVATDLGIPP